MRETDRESKIESEALKKEVFEKKRENERQKKRQRDIQNPEGTRVSSNLEQNWNQPKVDLQMLVFWAGNKV